MKTMAKTSVTSLSDQEARRFSSAEINSINRLLAPWGVKMCAHCWQVYSLDETNWFQSKTRKGTLTWRSVCRKCKRIIDNQRQAKRYQNADDRAAILERNRGWYKKHSDQVLASKKTQIKRTNLQKKLDLLLPNGIERMLPVGNESLDID